MNPFRAAPACRAPGRIVPMILAGWLCLWAGQLQAGEARGPLRVANAFPPYLMFLTPAPHPAGLPSPGQIEMDLALDYAAVFVNRRSDAGAALLDMEMGLVTFSGNLGIADRLALGWRIPFAHMDGGFLDPFLDDLHEAFGLDNYGRESRPDNTFGYEMRSGDALWLTGKSGGFHPTDMSLSVAYGLLDHRETDLGALTASLAWHLKLPVGDVDHGLGSGKWDHGFSLAATADMGNWHLHLSPGWFLLASPDTPEPGFPVDSILSFFLGCEYAMNPDLSLLAQIDFHTAPFHGTRIRELDEESMQLAVGMVMSLSQRWAMELAFCEDLMPAVPDFTIHLGLRFTPRGPGRIP